MKIEHPDGQEEKKEANDPEVEILNRVHLLRAILNEEAFLEVIR